MGLAHGAFCVGCCWSLMLVMFGVGISSLSAMLVLGGITAVEKNLPQGRRLTQKLAGEFSARAHLIILCGHYEGVDHRVHEHLADAEISIGDYVLTNGAIAAVVFTDAIVRLLPGVLGHEQSAADDSFSSGLLEAPQYTRPAEFRGWKVPDILLSGHHAEIAAWRRREAERRTRENRPDLLP